MENRHLHTKVEEAFNSLNGIERAEANPFLLTRVLEKMSQSAPRIIKPLFIWEVATTMVIVLGLNIGIGAYVVDQKKSNTPPSENGYFTNHIYNY